MPHDVIYRKFMISLNVWDRASVKSVWRTVVLHATFGGRYVGGTSGIGMGACPTRLFHVPGVRVPWWLMVCLPVARDNFSYCIWQNIWWCSFKAKGQSLISIRFLFQFVPKLLDPTKPLLLGTLQNNYNLSWTWSSLKHWFMYYPFGLSVPGIFKVLGN